MKKENRDFVSLGAGTLMAPLPLALVSSGMGEKANLFTAAWTGIINTDPPMLGLSIRPSRLSHTLISESRRFVVHLTSEELCEGVDFCGVRSGRQINKWEKLGWKKVSPVSDYPPLVAEAPLALLCEVRDILRLGSHDFFLADIKDVYVRGDLVDTKGALHLDKAKLVTYSHGEYYGLGKWLGFFGYSVAKPDVLARRKKKALASNRKKTVSGQKSRGRSKNDQKA